MPMNPYAPFVAGYARLLREGKSLPLGNIPPDAVAVPKPDAPIGLIFSPHPDDECIIGGLALRMAREAGMRIINVAVTLGSNLERREPRLRELRDACHWIGFNLELTGPLGLERIHPATRASDPEHWSNAVNVIAEILARFRPRVIFFPHDADWNQTHIGTHLLVTDALKTLPATFHCLVAETEFWAPMAKPNLFVELSEALASDLIAALSFHVGEVRRNPYHLRLPAWLQDNVRRGAELVGGQGAAAPDFNFAALYRLREWRNAELRTAGSNRILRTDSNLSELFAGQGCD